MCLVPYFRCTLSLSHSVVELPPRMHRSYIKCYVLWPILWYSEMGYTKSEQKKTWIQCLLLLLFFIFRVQCIVVGMKQFMTGRLVCPLKNVQRRGNWMRRAFFFQLDLCDLRFESMRHHRVDSFADHAKKQNGKIDIESVYCGKRIPLVRFNYMVYEASLVYR